MAIALAAVFGSQQAVAAPEDVQCLKPGAPFVINGRGYTGDSIDVRAAPEILQVRGDQVLLEGVGTFEQWFPLGVFSLADGAYSATVQVPKTTTFEDIPVERETVLGRANGGPYGGETLPSSIQLDKPSAVALVYGKSGNPTITLTPKVKVNGGANLEPYGWGDDKVYAHILRPNGTKLRTTYMGRSKIYPAFPCGRGPNTRFLSFAGATAGSGWKIVVNTKKSKASGGVKLKTTVKR